MYFTLLLKFSLPLQRSGCSLQISSINMFNAGNVLSLVVYPYLLCREMRKNNKEVNFKFKISINDYEQDFLDVPDFRKYPFNIYPQNSSFQFMPDEAGCCKDVVDHWQPIIESNILNIKKTFPKISFGLCLSSFTTETVGIFRFKFFRTAIAKCS